MFWTNFLLFKGDIVQPIKRMGRQTNEFTVINCVEVAGTQTNGKNIFTEVNVLVQEQQEISCNVKNSEELKGGWGVGGGGGGVGLLQKREKEAYMDIS